MAVCGRIKLITIKSVIMLIADIWRPWRRLALHVVRGAQGAAPSVGGEGEGGSLREWVGGESYRGGGWGCSESEVRRGHAASRQAVG